MSNDSDEEGLANDLLEWVNKIYFARKAEIKKNKIITLFEEQDVDTIEGVLAIKDLSECVIRTRAEEILISIASANSKQMQHIVTACQNKERQNKQYLLIH